MPKYVLLNNVEHKDLRVKLGYSTAYGDNVASTLTFPSEFGDVHKEYPILFQKNSETGKFQSIVLLGFKKGENLFLSSNDKGINPGWNANYVPGIVARGPFLIGFQDQSSLGGSEQEPVIYVDMESPRVGYEEGERVFREFGGATPYLENISDILRGIHAGMEISNAMFAIFEEFGLIEPIAIKIELNNGEKYSVEGNYTISEERLRSLDGAALEKLNRSGFLQGAFLVLSSLGNVKRLIDIKNASLNV
ncbi:peptide ABC transporter permease [Saccharophagus sp. K07]|uniref:SapC family protein n=1 Tax=Saccharophagus sp. K07 TaxID=2283636 RepID=UPI0016526028|nr:SapC family protein [Saccharophagus sp. K07]MBC6904958.1 peptide ABC transporter permease [Saccharophagus sp. K07]